MEAEKKPELVTISSKNLTADIDTFAKDVYTAKPEVSVGEAAMNITPAEKAEAVVIKEQEVQEIAKKMKVKQMNNEETKKRVAEKALSDQQESEQSVKEIIKDLKDGTYTKDEVNTSDDLTGLLEDEDDAHKEVDAIVEGLVNSANSEDTDAGEDLENVSNKKMGMNEVEDLTKL